MYFLNNEYLMSLIQENSRVIMPIMFPALFRSSKAHWNDSIHALIFNALKVFSEMNRQLFDECSAKFNAEVQKEADLKRERKEKWEKIQQLALMNPLSKKVGIVSPAAPAPMPTMVMRRGVGKDKRPSSNGEKGPGAGSVPVSLD